MNPKKFSKIESGFTLLEMMVGLIIFTVGMMGFAGMTIMMAKGNWQARTTNEAATLMQSEIENLAGIEFDTLGTDTGLPAPNGLDDAIILTKGPMNKNGEEIGTGEGPYTYTQYLVICESTDSGVTASGSPAHCGVLKDSNRPKELACDGLGLGVGTEKMIRILISWSDRKGDCRFRATNSLAYDWSGT